MTTLALKVGASADDASETAGTVSITATFFLSDSTDEYHGFRWQNVTIAPGATINSAILTVYVQSGGNDEPLHRAWGQAADNAAAFTTGASDISGRTKTTAAVDWSSADLGSGNDTPIEWGAATAAGAGSSFAAVIQEIVDRPGWASGNAIVIFDTQSSLDALRDLAIDFYDNLSTEGAELDIDYTAAGAAALRRYSLSLSGVG